MSKFRRKLNLESLENRYLLAALSIEDVSLVNEDAGTFFATVRLSEPVTVAVEVTVETSGGGSANAGQDFLLESKQLTIPAGTIRQSVEFTVLDDGDTESSEWFYLTLFNPVNATIDDAVAQVNLFDDDAGLFFGPRREIPTATREVWNLNAADFNGDGLTDLVAAGNVQRDELIWYENDGALGYTERVFATTTCFTCRVTAADVDGDGDQDILSMPVWNPPNAPEPLNELTIRWYENDGTANFTEHVVSGPDAHGGLNVADLDGDGDIDILAAYGPTSDSTGLYWYENDGAGSFERHTITADPTNPIAVTGADFDNDGDVDVLAIRQEPWSVSSPDLTFMLFENDGSAGFTLHAFPSEHGRFRALHRAADIDNDGDLDVFARLGNGACGGTALFERSCAVWYENTGSLEFTEHFLFHFDYKLLHDMDAVDLDADGNIDLVFNHLDSVIWLKNDGAGQFTLHDIEDVSSQGIHSIDVDGDGDFDILSGSGTSAQTGRLGWFENGDEDVEIPTAALSSVNSLPDGSLAITLDYSDNVGVSTFGMDSNDLDIITPSGNVIPAEFVANSTQYAQASISTTYAVAAPQGGLENGAYTIRMRNTQVHDTSGRYVAAGDLGTFNLSRECDFVGNGNGCDLADLDALYAGTNGAPSPLTDAAIDAWLAQATAIENPAKIDPDHTYVLGDTDLDGDVDSTDLGVLLNVFDDSSGLNWRSGNLNSDSVVNSTDLGRLLNNFGHVSVTTAATMVSVDLPADENDSDEDEDGQLLMDLVLQF